MRVGYLVHDLNDAAVARRIRMLATGGAELRVAGFHRSGAAPATVEGAPALALGRTADAALGRRALSTLAARARSIGAIRRHFGAADLIIARNLEMLALAGPLSRGGALVYECLDLHRLLTAPGPSGRALRALERWLCRKAGAILTSSPAFERIHLGALPVAGPVILTENKVLWGAGDAPPPPGPAPSAPPWRIGWFGALRCRRSLEILGAVAGELDGAAEIHIRGRPSPAVFPDFEAEVARLPHVTAHGPYRHPQDLPGIYGEVHFTWLPDFYEAGANSEWLLPNRLYEGCAFGAVPLARAGTETAAFLAARGIGVILDREAPGPDLARLIGSMTEATYGAARQAVLAVPRTDWYASAAECRALAGRLGALARPSGVPAHA